MIDLDDIHVIEFAGQIALRAGTKVRVVAGPYYDELKNKTLMVKSDPELIGGVMFVKLDNDERHRCETLRAI